MFRFPLLFFFFFFLYRIVGRGISFAIALFYPTIRFLVKCARCSLRWDPWNIDDDREILEYLFVGQSRTVQLLEEFTEEES